MVGTPTGRILNILPVILIRLCHDADSTRLLVLDRLYFLISEVVVKLVYETGC